MKHFGTLALLLGFTQAAWGSPIAPERFQVCFNFGCTTSEVVELSVKEWREVADWFATEAPNAAAEREQIRRAIGWMEVVVGKHLPTHRDRALNLETGGRFPGQLDCIDESLNTTTYLMLFESHGLLRWHTVVERAFRRAALDQHWSGQIEELRTGERFVIDTWFQDNGYLPSVQPAAEWKDVPFFFTSLRDNSDR
jgi:hypothetical protein